MIQLHSCSAMPDNCKITTKESGEYVLKFGDSTEMEISYCPFCGDFIEFRNEITVNVDLQVDGIPGNLLFSMDVPIDTKRDLTGQELQRYINDEVWSEVQQYLIVDWQSKDLPEDY